MKRLAFTKCNHGRCQVVKSDSNPPSSSNRNNVPGFTSQMLFFLFFFSWSDVAPAIWERLNEYLRLWTCPAVVNTLKTTKLHHPKENLCSSLSDVNNSQLFMHKKTCCSLYSLFYHILIMFSFCRFFPGAIHHPCSVTSLATALFVLSRSQKILQLLCGSPLWGENAWQDGEGRPEWKEEKETKLLHFQLEAKKQRLKRTRGRGGIRSHGFQLCQFEVTIREMHSGNTQQVLRHFPSHQKNCSWQQLKAP